MTDKPYFPKPPDPNASPPTAAASSVSTTTPATATTSPGDRDDARPAPLVLKRAEPPTDAEAKPKTSLDRDEIRALLSVTAERPRRSGAWSRARIAFLPVTVVGTLLHLFLGTVGLVASVVLTVAALVWCALPLLRRDDWS